MVKAFFPIQTMAKAWPSQVFFTFQDAPGRASRNKERIIYIATILLVFNLYGKDIPMEGIFQALTANQEYNSVMAAWRRGIREQLLYGLTGSQKTFIEAAMFESLATSCIIVTHHQTQAEQTFADLQAFLPGDKIFYFPVQDIMPYTVDARSQEVTARRLAVLEQLNSGKPCVVVAPVEALLARLAPRNEFSRRSIQLHVGQKVDREGILTMLVGYGYERVDQVEGPGQLAARGGIIDIFALNREHPIRLELFGDEIDSLRGFSVLDQRSKENLKEVTVFPAKELPPSDLYSTLFDYTTPDTIIFMEEPTRIRETVSQYIKEHREWKLLVVPWERLIQTARARRITYMTLLPQKIADTEPHLISGFTAKTIPAFHKQIPLLVEELRRWKERGFYILISATTPERVKGIQETLRNEGLESLVYSHKPKDLAVPGLHIFPAFLSAGFEMPTSKVVWLTEGDIYGKQKKKRIFRASSGEAITHFRDLKIGDYVVHVNHGIGKYVGVETLFVDRIHKDYFLLRYAGDDKLYIPTDQVHLLQKYIGAEGEAPKLHKLGGTEWNRQKSKAKASVQELAKDLIQLYAERKAVDGYAFSIDTPWQKEFEEVFPYEETPDQIRAIEEIKLDMESPKPMDRLLCGDVGFGKTEVAMRAAFKAVMDGKQVAVLVPTTILAQQHFQSFSKRMQGFPVNIDMISRFRTEKEQMETLKRVRTGQVDILIGTHRMIQSDLQFKDLGLLIVDEEQRFGVLQKEKLKSWQNNVDVLTLTATPIPRTLHMSLVGVRDMSILETPPEDRYPVQTYVLEFNAAVIQDAIRRERQRNGQVYFVYNRVQTIDKALQLVQELAPDAKVVVGHGQMSEDRLEKVMITFYEAESDILVSTSIVENGLDIPNVNTLIVYDADYFGLSQLYQLRGRVGRSDRLAYAYFTYRKDKILTEVAEKRLQAIKEFTELGSGFKIAMRDLEIRGAGNLLGAEQSGQMLNVGFEMYCRLLEEAVNELKDIPVKLRVAEPAIDLAVEAYITDTYISDGMQKIEVYQRIAASWTDEDLNEIYDEMIDRFGNMPEAVHSLLTIARIKNLARALTMQSIIQIKDRVLLTFTNQSEVDPIKVVAMIKEYRGKVMLTPGENPVITVRVTGLQGDRILNVIQEVLGKLATNP
jgi:transcription-repair coupling factor (superfamily II helicase)